MGENKKGVFFSFSFFTPQLRRDGLLRRDGRGELRCYGLEKQESEVNEEENDFKIHELVLFESDSFRVVSHCIVTG